MEVLLISATEGEIAPLLHQLPLRNNRIRLSVLVSGAGMVPTTWQLTQRLLSSPPDLVIHAGIAGTFHRDWPLGTVVELDRDCFADTGAKDKEGNFLSMFDLGLWQKDSLPFRDGWLRTPERPEGIPATGLLQTTGITVNTVNGYQPDISAFEMRYRPDIETMEAAAVFYACIQLNIPLISVRAISNYVEPRNRAAWDIPLAVSQLNQFLVSYLEAW